MSARRDDDLAAAVRGLARRDADAAPEFAAVLARPRHRTGGVRRPLVPRLGLAAAAASLLTIAWIAWSPARRGSDLDAAIAKSRAMSAWSAPTDAFLASTATAIPSTVPDLTLTSVTLPGGAGGSTSGR